MTRARVFLRALATLALVAVASDGTPATAAETDPYYAWRHHLTDSADAINEAAARIAALELDAINRGPYGPSLRCAEVARAITREMVRSGSWHPLGPLIDFGLDVTPDDNHEYTEEYLPVGIYRHTVLWPLGAFARIVPTLEIDGVLLGTDKLGHFFSEGRRYWRSYQEALIAGKSVREAENQAIEDAKRKEMSFFGWRTSGIFSFADMEANWQGFRYFRDLCEGDNPRLVYDVEASEWSLTEPLDIRDYVNPCWDEAYNPNGLRERHIRRVRQALQETCPIFYRPDVQTRWLRYKERGCDSYSQQRLMELVDQGELPDPRVAHIEDICPVPNPGS